MTINLKALVDPSQESGVPGGAELLEFSEAVIGQGRERLDAARGALALTLSPAAVSR